MLNELIGDWLAISCALSNYNKLISLITFIDIADAIID